MKNAERDMNNIFGAVLYVILISLAAFTFEANSNHSSSGSGHYSLQSDLAHGFYSSHSDSVAFDKPHLPVVVKDCGNSLYGPDLYPFALNYDLFDYNRKIVQKIILVEKSVLSIKSIPVWKYSCHPDSGEKEDLPVLS